jgi:hypothetical protein
MKKYSSPLDHVEVAAPCSADWNEMAGTEVKRFCGQCEKNVYNLSGMTKEEAEALIINTEGRLCVRFYRRADGTILTNNCPVGLRALKRRVSRMTNATISIVIGFLSGLGLYSTLERTPARTSPTTMGAIPVSMGAGEPHETNAEMGAPMMGAIASFDKGESTMGKVVLKKNYQEPRSTHRKK